MTVFAAAGDSGAYGCSTPSAPDNSLAVDFPAADPQVVAVGGTSLDDSTPASPQEQVWWSATGASKGFLGDGGGGGFSSVFPRPAYQASVEPGATARAVPDIALTADPASGFTEYVNGGTQQVGGTSLAAPLAAATFTDLLGSHGTDTGIGDIHANLYGAPTADFRDVTVGTNGFYAAGPGYDAASGLGAPLWNALAPSLIGNPVLSTPAYSTSRSWSIHATAPQGMVYSAWRAGTGSAPSSCDPTGASSSPPTTVTVGTDGAQTVWVVGYTASGWCYLDEATTVVDTVRPVAHVAAALAAPASSTELRMRWAMTDAAPSSGLGHFAVTVHRYGTAAPVFSTASTTATGVALPGQQGATYTVTVSAVDRAGNVSAPVSARVAVPIDDAAFALSGSWARIRSSGPYLATLSYTVARGAAATRAAVARSFSVLFATSASSGYAAIYLDGRYLRSVDLYSASTRYRVAVSIAVLGTTGRHTVTVKALGTHPAGSSGTRVFLDGLVATSY